MPDPGDAGPFKLADSASHLLHRAEQMAAERFTQLVGDTLTLRQYAVLAALAEENGVSQTELARATGIDRSTLAEMLKRMETRGWVTRTPSRGDARVHSVYLAATGAMILSGSTPYARAADAAILDSLPRTKRRTFLSILAKLAEIADEATAKAEREARKKAKREAKERAKARVKEKAKEKAKGEKAGKREGARKPRR